MTDLSHLEGTHLEPGLDWQERTRRVMECIEDLLARGESPDHYAMCWNSTRANIAAAIRVAIYWEREACAKVADAEAPKWNDEGERASRDIAAAIRSRA